PRGAAFRGGTHARKDLSTPAKDLAGADVLKIFRPVHIRKLARIGLDDDGTELDESVREPELLLLETSLEHRQGDAGDGRRARALGEPKRVLAPPTSRTPVRRRRAMARCRRSAARRARSRRA